MKKSCGILLAIMLLVMPSNAQQGLSVSTTLESYSTYILRGLNLKELREETSGDFELGGVVLQPGIALGFGGSGITVGAWGSFFLKGTEKSDSYLGTEIDLYADYSRILSEESGVGISVGFIEYIFPSFDDTAQEVYIGISLDNALSPTLTFYRGFKFFDGWYLTFSAGVDVPLGSEGGPTLNLGGRVAMSNYGNESSFNDVLATASIGFGVGSVSIAPTVGFSYAAEKIGIESDLKTYWGGVSIGFSP